MSEVTRMYELLYEERWDEKKQKERRNEAAFFSPESPITREIPIEELFDVLARSDAVQFGGTGA